VSKRSALRKSREVVEKLQDGEEFFPLLGRDRATPIAIRIWAHIWLEEIRMGARPESDRAQVTAGIAMASRMEIRLREQVQRKEHDGLTFDDRGIPTTGPHARREHNTTSGANDG